MDDGDAVAAVDLRMRVGVRGTPVRGPSRVSNPHAAVGTLAGHQPLESGNLAETLADLEAVSIDGRQPGRVIPPVLEPLECGRQHPDRLLPTDVTDYAAHM